MKPVPRGSSHLGGFQDDFARALIAPGAIDDCGSGVAALRMQPGFAVYRNTVLKGCIDALVANYPAVTRLVGEEWMRAAAAVFVRDNLPASPMLLEYGAAFPAFLAAFGPADELSYLPDVARLDRWWTEAHGARDETPLDAARVGALGPDTLATARLRPHASAHWAWFDERPIYSIWSRNRDQEGGDDEIAWRGEGALIVRPIDAVEWHPLGRGEVTFLDACAAGNVLASAAMAAVEVEPAIQLAQTIARLLSAGAFAELILDQR